jgi:tetratricopeptide (TPR) repeat protein
VAGGLALAGGLWVYWPRPGHIDPPNPDLADADPEVAERIAQARREVLAAPDSGPAWGRLGMVLRAHDFGEEANVCFAEAERLDPKDLRWPYLRGLTLVLTDPQAGIPCLERAVQRGEEEPAPRLRLVEVLLEQGRLDEAEHHLKAVLARAPHHPRTHLGLARLAFARTQWTQGLHHLEACGEDVHARKLAHTLRAEAFHRLGQAGRAAEELRLAREAPGDVPWPDPFVQEVEGLQVGLRTRLADADALAHEGRLGEAIALLEQVVRNHPDHGPAWLALGWTLFQARQPQRAERALAQAVRVTPEAVEAWFQLGVARFFLDDRRSAAEAFRMVVRLKPDHTLGHFNLGVCLKELGDRAGARRHLRSALACQPDYEPAQKALRELSEGENRK